MKFSFKHIGLLIGLTFVFISNLFFGRKQETFQVLLGCGFVMGAIFYLAIFFGKDQLRTKVCWTILVLLFALVQQMTEPFLVDTSYRIYISQNKNTLADVNSILINKQGDITVLNDSIYNYVQLSSLESEKIREAQKKLGVYIISKTDAGVYYGLWAFIDIRLGIIYLKNNVKAQDNYRHLVGNWFH